MRRAIIAALLLAAGPTLADPLPLPPLAPTDPRWAIDLWVADQAKLRVQEKMIDALRQDLAAAQKAAADKSAPAAPPAEAAPAK